MDYRGAVISLAIITAAVGGITGYVAGVGVGIDAARQCDVITLKALNKSTRAKRSGCTAVKRNIARALG